MQDGFVKVAAVTPEVRVADVAFNVDACVRAAQTACTVHGAMVVTLPELCLTAYTCEDLLLAGRASFRRGQGPGGLCPSHRRPQRASFGGPARPRERQALQLLRRGLRRHHSGRRA